jgi:methylene-fatty-acyl-phospholipid synthase
LKALLEQPHARILPAPLDALIPVALFTIGQTLVVTSSWALGITGRFLGDYFGILMDHRVEGFPYNILRDPMYVGSTMCFAATALWCVSVVRRTRDTRSGAG